MPRPDNSGHWGEEIARDYLIKKGYRFLQANWLCKAGEIDLIMQDGETRVFVEVKTRRPTLYGEGSDVVAWQKQRKLIKAMYWYCAREKWWGEVRMDVIAIELEDGAEPVIDHIEYAISE